MIGRTSRSQKAPAILSAAVISAKAGIHDVDGPIRLSTNWVPSFAGMTGISVSGAWACLDSSGRNSYNVGMKTIVSEKGQITIPKPLRVRLGLRTGQVLEVREERGRLVMSKQATPRDAIDQVYGILKLDRSTDELIDELRGSERPK